VTDGEVHDFVVHNVSEYAHVVDKNALTFEVPLFSSSLTLVSSAPCRALGSCPCMLHIRFFFFEKSRKILIWREKNLGVGELSVCAVY